MTDRSAKLRAFYASFVTGTAAVRDPRIEQAFAAIPREPFAGPAPWSVLLIQPWFEPRSEPRYISTADDDPAFLYQDIADDLPKANVVYVNAGITQPSWTWLDTLQPGGRLLFPSQPEGSLGGMLLVQRPMVGGPVWPARFASRATFIPCHGLQDQDTGRALAQAFVREGGRP